MNTKPEISPTESHPDVAAGIIKRVGTVAISFVLIAAILFLAAGQLNWMWAWVYLGICLVSVLINASIMLRTSPETIAERGRPEETKDWDKVIGGLWAAAIYIALPLVAGLDMRFGWARDSSIAWHVAGAVVFAIGLGFSAWAMIANAYFSTAVRIQSERGHTVCSTGPYQFVRHPGYVGFILQSISVPFLLGSLWALIPGIIATILMIIRTSLEDRTLQAELPGYQEYVQKVRQRLVPGIW
ncbi:methyltransferase family protein [Candidatus Neomarinimicrobiota bacterium]